MTRMLNVVGDRLLRAVLPKAEAKARTCWWSGSLYCCYYEEMPVPRTYCW